MIFPERMVRLTVVGPNRVLERSVKELYSLKALHIVEHSKSDIDIGKPLTKADELSSMLVTVRALIANLGFREKRELDNGFKAVGVKNFSQLAKTIKKAQEELKSKETAISSIEDRLRLLKEKAAALKNISDIDVPVEDYQPYNTITYFVGFVSKDVKKLHSELLKLTDKFELYSSADKKTIALFIDKRYVEKARNILDSYDFAEVDITPLKELKGLPVAQIAALAEEEAALMRKISVAKHSLYKAGRKWKDFLLLSERFLAMEVEKAEAPLKFASTKNIFVITGWIPESKLNYAKERLLKAGMNKVSIEATQPKEDEAVPVKLDNPKSVKPFEFFIRLYAMPKYAEIDPTVFFLVTFPVFFGFILGDIGYGLVTLAFFLFLKRKFPRLADLLNVMAVASFSSIVFGFLFGEFFGEEEVLGMQLPHLLSRVHQINELLILSVAIGIIHINFGLLLGFFNTMRMHSIKSAIYEKASWVLLQIGAAMLGVSILGYAEIPPYYAYGTLLLAIVLLFKGESIKGLIELPSIFSNILSYARLMAVGVASASLAIIINEFAGKFFHKGGIFIIAALLVLVTGHAMNIGLGILGGFLQSIRLHYVEFFTKFYKGGAIPYRPFGIR